MAALNPDAPEFNPPTFTKYPYHPWNAPYGLPVLTYDIYPEVPCFLSEMPPSFQNIYPNCNFLDPGHLFWLLHPTPKVSFPGRSPHPTPTHQPLTHPLLSKPLQDKVDQEKKVEKLPPASAAGDVAEDSKPGEVGPVVFSKCSTLKGNTSPKMEGRRGHGLVWVRRSRSRELGGCGKTTLMIRHIPVKYTKEMLLQFLDEHCKAENEKLTSEEQLKNNLMSAYDFIYLPIDFRTKCNKGYAFVNFTNVIGACRLRRVLEGHKWEVLGSKKICHITYARIQGRGALKKHFESSAFPCETEAYLPIFFDLYRNGSCGFEDYTVGILVSSSEKKQFN